MVKDMQDTLRASEIDDIEAYSKENEGGNPSLRHRNELFDKLELREVNILRRMVKNEQIWHTSKRRCGTLVGCWILKQVIAATGEPDIDY